MLLRSLITNYFELTELKQLEELRRDLLKTTNKHRRKLIRISIYLRWEEKYKDKKFKLYFSRLISGRLFKTSKNLQSTFNSLSALIGQFQKANKFYVELIKQS